MRVLGIAAYGHDSAAAMVVEGHLVAAVEEERFSGIKHDGAFPRNAARWCVAMAGGVDRIAFYHRPWHRTATRLGHALRHLPRSAHFLGAHRDDVGGWLAMLRLSARGVASELGIRRSPPPPLHHIEHHVAHAWAAIASDVGDGRLPVALLSIDGMGEWDTTWMGSVVSGKLRPWRRIPFPHSLGIFWEAVTEHLGFRPHADEYKVMGLAAYGDPTALPHLRHTVGLHRDGTFRLNLRFFRHQWGAKPYAAERFGRHFGPPRMPGEALTERHIALAAAAQALLEETALHMARHLHANTGCERLCLTGGVALNSKMNGVLLRDAPFRDIVVSAAPHDAGSAAGAAFALSAAYGHRPRPAAAGPYLGPSLPPLPTRSTALFRTRELAAPVTEAASRIARGEIIGWFQGRMEFGPRALGNRSILATPDDPATRDRINKRIKGREPFRPLAPAILAEYLPQLFDRTADCTRMSFALPLNPVWRDRFAAATHADGTARVQAVPTRGVGANPLFRCLLEECHRRTRIPGLVNTSLNLAGQPLVRTFADALRVLLDGELDALIIGSRLYLPVPGRSPHAAPEAAPPGTVDSLSGPPATLRPGAARLSESLGIADSMPPAP
jgi:carbamoyltransferase